MAVYFLKLFLLCTVILVYEAADFNLDDLTEDEKAKLEEEVMKAFLAESAANQVPSENRTDQDEENDAAEDDQAETLESFTETMARMMQKAFDSETMKDIIRKRIAETNFTEYLLSNDNETESESIKDNESFESKLEDGITDAKDEL